MIECTHCGLIFVNSKLMRIHKCQQVETVEKKLKIKDKEIKALINELVEE